MIFRFIEFSHLVLDLLIILKGFYESVVMVWTDPE